MKKFSTLIILLLAINHSNCFPSLPAEPKLPSTVCTTLSAALLASTIDSDDSKADTSRIQTALNGCGAGKAVKLVTSGSNNAFLIAPITLPTGVTLWIDKGVTLYASRIPADFSKVNNLITATNTANSGIVGEGIIDGRGGTTLSGQSKSWWDLAADARAANAKQDNPRMVHIEGGTNFLLYKISIFNAPHYHVIPHKVDGFIAWGVKLQTPTAAYPKWTADTVKWTDGIDPSASSNVVIAHSYIHVGDDHVAIKGSGKVENVLIAHNHFYAGHGMSIGSETNGGVSNMLVTDLTIDGGEGGIRVKSDASKGGDVHNIRYENVCMRNVNGPIGFDAYYSDATGTLYPNFYDITLSGVHIVSSTKKQVMFRGYNDKYPVKVTLDNVQSDVALTMTESHAEIKEGPGTVKNLGLTATADVKISGTTTTVAAISCTFPSFGN